MSKVKQYFFRAELQHMAKADVHAMISPDTLARIKENDPSPEIRVYSVGGEGKWSGRNVTLGKQIINFFRDAVVSLHDKIRLGLEIFKGHGSTNDHAGRTQIGEVVGKALRNIGGKLNTLAAVYIYPEHRKEDLDVASIESEMVYRQEPGGEAEAIEFDNVSAIALGNSETEQPGFAGATLLGAIQAFTKKGDNEMNLEEIKEYIKEKGVKITQLFSNEEIVESEPAKKAKQTEYEHAKRVEKKLGEERENTIKLQKELDEASEKIGKMNVTVNKTKTENLFNSTVKDRKLSERQQKFIQKNLEKFDSAKSKDDEIQDDFAKFIDGQLTEYKQVAEMLGVKDDDGDAGNNNNNGGDNGDKGGKGTGPADGKQGSASEVGDAYTDPTKNDLIPG